MNFFSFFSPHIISGIYFHSPSAPNLSRKSFPAMFGKFCSAPFLTVSPPKYRKVQIILYLTRLVANKHTISTFSPPHIVIDCNNKLTYFGVHSTALECLWTRTGPWVCTGTETETWTCTRTETGTRTETTRARLDNFYCVLLQIKILN